MSLTTAIGSARPGGAEAAIPAWRLPSPDALRTYLLYASLVGVLFVIGYGGANWLASQRDVHLKLFLDAELAIPLLPAMIWVYLSINLLFVLPVFRLDVAALRLLGLRMIAATVIASLIFLAMPTTIGFSRANGAEDPAFVALYALDHPFNCVPSLHVAYSTLIVTALARNSRRLLKSVLRAWLALIMASTVLTHQHHVIDIAAALLFVAFICLALPGNVPAPTKHRKSLT